MKQRLLTVLIALDIFVFALFTLGHCKRGETISAALWSLEQDGKWQGRLMRPAIDALLRWLEPDHCQVSYFSEKDLYPKD